MAWLARKRRTRCMRAALVPRPAVSVIRCLWVCDLQTQAKRRDLQAISFYASGRHLLLTPPHAANRGDI